MENSTMQKTRTIWIDNLKGVLLFLIVIGHLGSIPSEVRWLLRPTDLLYVPAFFFLSGLLFNNEKYTFKEFLKRKSLSLLLPYLSLSLLITVLDWNLYRNPVQTLQDSAMSILFGDGALKATPLWFVSTLFMANILLKLGYVTKNKVAFHLFFLAMPFACYALYVYEIRLPLRIDSALGACFMMYAAQIFQSASKSTKIFRVSALVICLAVTVIGIVNGIGLLNYNTVHSSMSFPAAVCGCVILCAVFRKYVTSQLPPHMVRSEWLTNSRFALLSVFLY